MVVEHDSKLINNTTNLKFQEIITDNTLSWKGHIDKIVPRLSQACYIIRLFKPFLLQVVLTMIYYAYLHSVKTYGLLFWGNSSHSMEIFRLQNKIIRITMAARSIDSCMEFFKIFGILPLMDQQIFYSNIHCQ